MSTDADHSRRQRLEAPHAQEPAIVRVRTMDRAQEVVDFCTSHGVEVIVGVEPDKTEYISDTERALQARQPAIPTLKVGPNDPCPCGSGRKFKKCCHGRQPESAS